jgi:hypothetical protein
LEDVIAEVEGEELEVIFMEDWNCGCEMTVATALWFNKPAIMVFI